MPEMRVLLDACGGYATEEALRAVRADVAHMLRIRPSMPDREVLALASAEDRLLITLDRKISDLVFVHALPHAGVLLVREPDLVPAERARLIANVVRSSYADMVGRFSTLSGGRLRMHKGPAPG